MPPGPPTPSKVSRDVSVASVEMKEGKPTKLDSLKKMHYSGTSVRDMAEGLQPVMESLLETEGEFEDLMHMPKPKEPNMAVVRWPTLYRLKRWFPKDFFFTNVSGLLWFINLLWPFALIGLCFSIIAWRAIEKGYPMYQTSDILANLQRVHGLFGAILSLTIVFRTNAANDRYYEGRKVVVALGFHMGELVMEAYTAMGQDTLRRQNDEALHAVPQDMRRRVNIIFALIRQLVREAKFGFIPGSEMEYIPFTDSTFYMDPVRPRLWDLLTKPELAKLMHQDVDCRVASALGELKALVQIYSEKLAQPGIFIGACNAHLKGIHECCAAMHRITQSPVPYPYVYILNVTNFCFVYATPFLYASNRIALFLGTQLLVCSYYGLSMIGTQLEDPFGYDSFDIPLETYSRRLHDQTLSLATSLGKDTKSFIPDYLTGDKEEVASQ